MENESDLTKSINKLRDFWKKQSNLEGSNNVSLELMKKTQAQRKDFFDRHSFRLAESGLNGTEEYLLKNSSIIFSTDEGDKLKLTIKGLILMEFDLDISDNRNERFLNEINKYYFETLIRNSNSPLKAQEKGVIIALLGLLAITPDNSVKLSPPNAPISNVNDFKLCVDKSLAFLKSLGDEYKDNTADQIWKLNVIGEDPVSARFNRLDYIHNKTNSIYVKGKNKGHYLDLMDNGNLNRERLEFLLRKIFNSGTLDYKNREEFVKLLNDIYSERYKVVNNSPDFDELKVKNIIERSVKSF